MHSEPEIALNVNGKQWQNQIELIRRISQNIPINSVLIIKEHPRNIGYRSLKYYSKLASIPNLRIIHSDVPTNIIIDECDAVLTVSGIVGLEALYRGKPAIVFGDVNYSCLAGQMLLMCTSTRYLHSEIHDFITKFKPDEFSFKCYIKAVLDYAIPINFYSDILQKSSRVSFEDGPKKFDAYETLARHFIDAVNNEGQN